MNTAVHVVPDANSGWRVIKNSSHRALRRFDKKAEAIVYARSASKKEQSELVIHNASGNVERVSSYGKDPLPPK